MYRISHLLGWAVGLSATLALASAGCDDREGKVTIEHKDTTPTHVETEIKKERQLDGDIKTKEKKTITHPDGSQEKIEIKKETPG